MPLKFNFILTCHQLHVVSHSKYTSREEGGEELKSEKNCGRRSYFYFPLGVVAISSFSAERLRKCTHCFKASGEIVAERVVRLATWQ